MKSAKLTPARRRALEVLAKAEKSGHDVRISNVTNAACVYWQSADWLISNGLAELYAYDHIRFTSAGRDIAAAVVVTP